VRYPPLGFTLVEIVAALAVMAVATAIVVPSIQGGMQTREIWREARYFAATLRHLRHEALVSGEIQELVIATDRHAYQASGLEGSVALPETAAFLAVEGGHPIGAQIVRVLFFPNGGTTGVNVVVGAREDPEGARYRVTLDPLIGTVTVDDGRV
jgi:prepilin-type N-terminal cleavage/methylation domain-containing protein